MTSAAAAGDAKAATPSARSRRRWMVINEAAS
jgi:hypothetical protein